VLVSGAACKAAYNAGLIRGQLGDGPEKNPWWGATEYVKRRYMGAWETGRQQGRRDVEQLVLEV
jgi:hypothetical protein